jgi:hypothetical protein
MTVLLDENIPRKLKWRLIERDFEVITVPERGWAGVTNGEPLRRAEDAFDVLRTMDHQRNIANHALGVVTVVAPNNEYETLLPLVPEMTEALRQVEAGAIVSVAAYPPFFFRQRQAARAMFSVSVRTPMRYRGRVRFPLAHGDGRRGFAIPHPGPANCNDLDTHGHLSAAGK